MQEFYRDEEMQEILRNALRNSATDQAVSREELLRTGAEMGLDEAQIVRAEAEIAAARDRERLAIAAVRERERRKIAARRSFVGHFATYALTILFLLIVNLISSPGYLWVVWPALGWGLGVASQAIAALFPKDGSPAPEGYASGRHLGGSYGDGSYRDGTYGDATYVSGSYDHPGAGGPPSIG